MERSVTHTYYTHTHTHTCLLGSVCARCQRSPLSIKLPHTTGNHSRNKRCFLDDVYMGSVKLVFLSAFSIGLDFRRGGFPTQKSSRLVFWFFALPIPYLMLHGCVWSCILYMQHAFFVQLLPSKLVGAEFKSRVFSMYHRLFKVGGVLQLGAGCVVKTFLDI